MQNYAPHRFLSAGVLVLSLVFLSGCQSTQTLPQQGALTNAEFMNLWGIYRDCRSATNLDAMKADVLHLHRGAQQEGTKVEPLLPLPKPVTRLMAKPPVRLSVDPRAMAADCALSTGHVALGSGHDEVALEMFSTVLVSYSQADYPYFVEQARLGLRELTLRADAARKKTPLSQAVSAR